MGVFYQVPKTTKNNPTEVARCLKWVKFKNHAPTIYTNKVNTKVFLTVHTVDICRHVIL